VAWRVGFHASQLGFSGFGETQHPHLKDDTAPAFNPTYANLELLKTTGQPHFGLACFD
jgi:hypothetical protein